MRVPKAQFQGSEKAAILRAQLRIAQQIRPVAQRLFKRLLPTPAANLLMVSTAQDLGHGQSAELSWASVVGIIEQSTGAMGRVQTGVLQPPIRRPKAFVLRGCVVAQDPGAASDAAL